MMGFLEWVEFDRKKKEKEKKIERSNRQSNQENGAIHHQGQAAGERRPLGTRNRAQHRAGFALPVTRNTRRGAGRARDAAAGRALIGPHRSDLLVTHMAKEQAAALCSTGEQKALLLGIVLAHGALIADRTGRPPLLLLDEVAAHLDPLRRAALFDHLRATGGQVWMTGTEPALFSEAGAEAMRLIVQNGQVRA